MNQYENMMGSKIQIILYENKCINYIICKYLKKNQGWENCDMLVRQLHISYWFISGINFKEGRGMWGVNDYFILKIAYAYGIYFYLIK